jgi:hypothetical protein
MKLISYFYAVPRLRIREAVAPTFWRLTELSTGTNVPSYRHHRIWRLVNQAGLFRSEASINRLNLIWNVLNGARGSVVD